MNKTLPNALSILRIVLALALLYPAVNTAGFFALYAACGLSDWLDGFLARRLHAESELGALLDSLGDAVFLAVALTRILPLLEIPRLVAGVILAIAVVRATSLGVSKKRFGRATFLHTRMNKAAGLTLYVLLPLAAVLPHAPLYAAGCTVAGLAAVEELILVGTMPALDVNVRGLFVHKSAAAGVNECAPRRGEGK